MELIVKGQWAVQNLNRFTESRKSYGECLSVGMKHNQVEEIAVCSTVETSVIKATQVSNGKLYPPQTCWICLFSKLDIVIADFLIERIA